MRAMPKVNARNGKAPLAVLAFESAGAWEAWLKENHETCPGIWLKFARKASGVPTVVYAEALEVALCYGWIDGQVKQCAEDGRYYLQRFTPRTARSKWSKVNRAKAEALIAAGRMAPAGLRQVEAARADGRWDAAYDSPGKATVPEDLEAALAKNKAARAFFATLTGRNRYAILYRIQDARRPETRARRVKEFVAMLARRETVYP
jgi:uncharacterized protein YdeI (YjbR/CyaY-like superfamily)